MFFSHSKRVITLAADFPPLMFGSVRRVPSSSDLVTHVDARRGGAGFFGLGGMVPKNCLALWSALIHEPAFPHVSDGGLGFS